MNQISKPIQANQPMRHLMLIAVLCLPVLPTLSSCARQAPSPTAPRVDVGAEMSRLLVECGREMYKLDRLAVERVAQVSNSKRREGLRNEVAGLSGNYANDYRLCLISISRMPIYKVDGAIRAALKPGESETLLPVIQLHLRLARAQVTPQPAAIRQDFETIRYKDRAQKR